MSSGISQGMNPQGSTQGINSQQHSPKMEQRQSMQNKIKSEGSSGVGSQSGDGLKHLIHEHEELTEEFGKFKQQRNSAGKREITDKIRRMLAVHASIEERFFYPLIRDRLELGKDLYTQMRFAHQHIKETLELLINWQPDQQGYVFDEMVAYLETLVTMHMKFEEKAMQQLRAKMNHQELSQLNEDLKAGEETAPTYPHPEGPSSEMGAKIMHPVVGMMDKAKDKMKDMAGSAKETLSGMGIGSTEAQPSNKKPKY